MRRWRFFQSRDAAKRTADAAAMTEALVALVPQPWDAERFVANYSRYSGREIWTMPWPFPADSDISALWLPLPQHDWLLVSENAVEVILILQICHEIAHMAYGHKARDLGFFGSDAVLSILPHLKVATRRMATLMIGELARQLVGKPGILYRHDYDTQEERDAESLATVLFQAATRPPPSPELTRIYRALL